MRRGSDYVVARTNQPLDGNALIDAAIDHAHRALDLTSVEDGEHLLTKEPADENIVLEQANGRRVVRIQSIADTPFSMNLAVTRTRVDGTVEAQPVRQPLAWTPAFRFHRMSQGGRDLFDAYRNMFLGLEALLDQLWPKRRQEKEEEWLLRSIALAGTNVDLARLAAPGVADPVRDLVDRIYGVRVQLFHAKTGRSLIPDERISYTTVAEAYPLVLTLWTEIVSKFLSLERGSSGITNQYFRMMIEHAYASVRIGVTADDSPAEKIETTPSPRGLPMSLFEQPGQIIELQPGRVGLLGRTEVSLLPTGQVIGRVLTVHGNGIPLTISPINGGLKLDGADVLETITMLRLINRGQPRTEFY